MKSFLMLLSLSSMVAVAAPPPGMGGSSARGDGAVMAYDSMAILGKPVIATSPQGDIVKFQVVKVLRGESVPKEFTCGIDENMGRFAVPYQTYLGAFDKANICRGEAFVLKDPGTQNMIRSAQGPNTWQFKEASLYQEILEYGARN